MLFIEMKINNFLYVGMKIFKLFFDYLRIFEIKKKKF